MHINRLSFGALGPFPAAHTIDFDALGGSALFLIDGPTGAGKSTVIDAIVFALYGDVAGNGSDRQRLRSAFATPADESFAELVFTTSAGRYRVHRTPEYERAKVRGTGTTRAASTVRLERATGPDAWEPVSSRQGEADAEIARLVGLNRVQFLQTVVLPQGEFATFLAAESKDRLAVLERIFATSLYSRIEAALDDARRGAEAAREQADREVAGAVQHVRSRLSDADLAGLGVEAEPDTASVIAALGGLIEAVDARAIAEETALASAAAGHARALADLGRLESLAAARLRVQSTRDLVAEAVDRRAVLRAALDEHAAEIVALELGDASLGDLVSGVDRAIGALDPALEAERRLVADAAERDRRRRAVESIEVRIQGLEAERDHDLPTRMLTIATALRDAVAEAARVAGEATAGEAALVQARLDGMASELAGALVEGSPCVVCGSAHHPAPAPAAARTVTATDLAAAARERTEAEATRQALEVEQARLDLVAADLVPPSADSAPSIDVPAPAGGMSAAELTRGVQALQQRIADVGGSLREARDEHGAMLAELAGLEATMAERSDLVAAALAGHSSIDDRRVHLITVRGRVAAVLEAEAAVAQCERDLAEATVALDALVDDPLADEAALPGLRAACESLEAQAGAARSRLDATRALLDDLRTRSGLAEAALAARDQCWSDTADVISLANVVKGGAGNALSQPLSAFVVQTMFDEILASANRRLRSMLDGRFELQSTEGRTSRRLMGLGLGLEVLDLRTDTVRRTSTLSGGETFCASLALALGLADTVRAHAGGVEIGMLLIDEGFGSLDGERLDEVMAELLRLRADGRTVGVISHVAEMKRSIPERIDVRPLGARLGSTLDVSWTD